MQGLNAAAWQIRKPRLNFLYFILWTVEDLLIRQLFITKVYIAPPFKANIRVASEPTQLSQVRVCLMSLWMTTSNTNSANVCCFVIRCCIFHSLKHDVGLVKDDKLEVDG